MHNKIIVPVCLTFNKVNVTFIAGRRAPKWVHLRSSSITEQE